MNNNNNKKSNTAFHLGISLLATIATLFWFFSSVFDESYPERSVYQQPELRFTNLSGVRVADYAIKKANNSFLIAPGTPKELKLSIEFSAAGNYLAVVEAEYPDWLCKPQDINKAFVDIKGGSANERVKLVNRTPGEIAFSIAKGQRLSFSVRNTKNPDCGRAIVTFYKHNHKLTFTLLYCLLWAVVFLLCCFARVSPYVATLGVLINMLLIAADASLGSVSNSGLIVNMGLSMIVVAGLFVVALLPKSRLISLLGLGLLACLCIYPLAFLAYAHVFSAPMSGEAIHGAMQSYDSQILEFWQQFIGKKRTLLFVGLLLILYCCLRHINTQRARVGVALTYCLVFLLAGVAVTAGRLHESAMSNLLYRSVIEYKWEIAAFKKVADRRKDVSTQARRKPAHVEDTTVIVIGESVNRKFMSSYGYVKETTPLLDRRVKTGETILFRNAYSNHSHSNPTMSFILTQANQYNKGVWLESPSVFNYAKAASVETHWLTNHRLLGGWSNHITTIINEADRLKTINYKIGIGTTSSNYDEDLVPLYKDAIGKYPNQLTFLHLYNSHSYYCNRYPEDAKRFPLELPISIYGNLAEIRKTSAELLSCYINTIHYADGVLEKLVKELELRSNPSVLVYVADHAEEPLDGRTHNSANFTYDMVNIPLFVWANDAWREAHPKKWQNLIDNKSKVLTNDLMFESILGIAGITSPEIDFKYDISSDEYESLENPLTLHGRITINDAENWNYWQSKNGELAKKLGLKMIAADIESVGQAYAASMYGVSKLHINAQYSESNGIQLSSNSGGKPIMALSEFLDAISRSDIKSLLISLTARNQKSTELVSKEIAQLKTQSEIAIELLADKPLNLAQLSSPQFATSLESKFDFSERNELWIEFKSRYTDFAPAPK